MSSEKMFEVALPCGMRTYIKAGQYVMVSSTMTTATLIDHRNNEIKRLRKEVTKIDTIGAYALVIAKN